MIKWFTVRYKLIKSMTAITNENIQLKNEIRILGVVINSNCDSAASASAYETRVEELNKRLKNLQGKYDSKVARYRKIIREMENKQ